jgi:hypothetical protein
MNMAYKDKKWVYIMALRFTAEESQLIDNFFQSHPELHRLKIKTVKKIVLDAVTEEGRGEQV